MNLFKEVLEELYKMFVADIRLTMAVICLVLVEAAFIEWVPLANPTNIGFVLLAGCLLILIVATSMAARRSRRP